MSKTTAELQPGTRKRLRTWFSEASLLLSYKEKEPSALEKARRRSLAPGLGAQDSSGEEGSFFIANSSLGRLRELVQSVVHAWEPNYASSEDSAKKTTQNEDTNIDAAPGSELDEILENLSLDAFLCLVNILLHGSPKRRREALQLLFSLAKALHEDRKVSPAHFISAMHLLYQGIATFDGVQEVFTALAPNFESLCTWVVPPLEAMLVHPNPEVRMLSVSVICSFLVANSRTFGDNDLAQSLEMLNMVLSGTVGRYDSTVSSWALHSAKSNQGSEDNLRAAQTESLEKSVVLAAITQVLETATKTSSETNSASAVETEVKNSRSWIKTDVLLQMFQTIIRRIPVLDKERDAARACIKIIVAHLSAKGCEAELFQSLTSTVSSNYQSIARSDFSSLCHISVQTCEQSTQVKAVLGQFLTTLERFILAPQPSLRYCALVCVNAVLSAFPADLLRVENSTLFPILLTSSLDNKPCQAMSLECLKLVCEAGIQRANQGKGKSQATGADAREAVIRNNFYADICELQSGIQRKDARPVCAEQERMSLHKALSRGIALCSNYHERVLAQLSAGLQYLPPAERLHRMESLLLWSKKFNQMIPFVANNLLMSIRGADVRTGELTVQIFESMAPTISKALQDRNPAQPLSSNVFYKSLCAIDTVFRQVMDTCRDSLVTRIIKAMATLPYEYFDEARLRSLCQTIIRKSFGSQLQTRLAIYELIGECSKFWHTESLKAYAFATMLTCAGDFSASATKALCRSMKKLLEDQRRTKLASFVTSFEYALRKPFLQDRLQSYGHLVHTLRDAENVHIREIFLSHDFFHSSLSNTSVSSESQKSHWPLFAAFMLTQLGSSEHQTHATRVIINSMSTQAMHERDLAIDVLAMCIQQDEGISTPMLLMLLEDTFKALIAYKNQREVDRHRSALLISELQVLKRLIPLQVDGLARSLVQFFSANVVDLISRETTEADVRVACVDFISALLRARPLDCSPLAQTLRDALHSMIGSSRSELAHAALEAYPLIFKLSSQYKEDAEAAFEFLRTDLALFDTTETVDADDDGVDAFVESSESSGQNEGNSRVARRQSKVLLKASLRALGNIRCASVAPLAIDILLNVIHDPTREFRIEAARSILSLSEMLGAKQSVALRWVILPLYQDLTHVLPLFIEKAQNRGQEGEGEEGTEPDDSYGNDNLLFSSPKEEDLQSSSLFRRDTPFIPVRKPRQDGTYGFTFSTKPGSLATGGRLGASRQSDGLESMSGNPGASPTITLSDQLLHELQFVLANFCGELIPPHVDLVQYHYFQFMQSTHSSSCAILLLGELGIRVFDFEEAKFAGEIPIKSERFRGILASLILDIDAAEGIHVPGERPQRKASAIALRLLASHAPNKVLPFTVNNLCQLKELNMGHLMLLKQIFRLFNLTGVDDEEFSERKARPQLAELIATADAKVLTGLLLRSIQSSKTPIDERRAALELVMQTALLSGDQELSTVVRSILDMLEENSDAVIHQISQEQLSRVFSTFSNEHPLVVTLVDHVESGLLSCEVNKRHRAFTLWSIVGKRMGPEFALPSLIRALCDPTEKLQRLAVRSLLCSPPEFILKNESFVASIRDLANRIELEKSAETRKRNMQGKGKRKEAAMERGASLTSPPEELDEQAHRGTRTMKHSRGNAALMQDDDPLNVNFLQSDPSYLQFLDLYGLSPASGAASLPTLQDDDKSQSTKGSRSKNGDSQAAATNPFGFPESAFQSLLTCPMGPLVQILVAIHPSVGARLLEAIHNDIEICKNLLSRSAGALKDLKAEDFGKGFLGYGELEMEQLLHGFTVHASILFACDNLPSEWPSILPLYQELVIQCATLAQQTRLLASAKMDLGSLMGSEKISLPVISIESFESLEKQRADLLAQLGTDQQHKITAAKRDALQQQLVSLNHHLWVMAKLQGVLLDTLGTIYRNTSDLDDHTIADGLSWLLIQLSGDQHRKLRSVTSNIIISLSSVTSRGDEFRRLLGESLLQVQEKLEHSRPGSGSDDALHRAKVELLQTFVRLIPQCAPMLITKILPTTFKLLVAFWDDRDSHVRQTAISLTEELGRSSSPIEVRSILFDPNALDIRAEISRRTSNSAYPDRQQLMKLSQWAQQMVAGKS